MRIIYADEKHENRVIDANTDAALARASLALLRARWDEGWYEEPESAEPPYTAEQIAALPDRSRARRLVEAEIAGWQSQEQQRREYRQWYLAVEQLLAQPKKEALKRRSKLWTGRLGFVPGKPKTMENALSPYESFPTAWVALVWRSKQGYEYETVRLEETERLG